MRNDFQSDAEKDPNELEREIDEQRAHLLETIEALEKRFSPGQIMDQVLSYTRSNSGEFSRNLIDSVKANPLPTLLTATGLAWMMYGQNRSQSHGSAGASSDYPTNASYGVDPAYQQKGGDGKSAQLKEKSGQLKDKAGQMRHGAEHSLDSARERMQHMGSSAQGGAQGARRQLHDASDAMRQQASRAGDSLGHMLKEQPLALGAMGIALGALIGASLPRTQREDELLGEQRDQLAEQAKQRAQEGYQKASQQATEMGERVADDVKQEARSVRQQNSKETPSQRHH